MSKVTINTSQSRAKSENLFKAACDNPDKNLICLVYFEQYIENPLSKE